MQNKSALSSSSRHGDDETPTITNTVSRPSLARVVADLLTIVYTLGFVNFRIVELVLLLIGYPTQTLTSVVATIGLIKVTKQQLPWNAIVILALMISVYITDFYLLEPVPSVSKKTTIVITGANSGVGFESAKALAQHSDVTVIMGCRSMTKCHKAADDIIRHHKNIQSGQGAVNNVIPMHLDLGNLESVQQFAKSLSQPVDILFNNAGYIPPVQETPNQYGLDPSFLSMHLSHHLLAELLVEQNPQLRLVATSSGTHHICAISNILPQPLQAVVKEHFLTNANGCITEEYLQTKIYSATNEDKYIVAKLANILHVSEFPRQHPQATAVAIDLGWVGTSIQPWMSGQITPTSLGWMRPGKIGIYPMLQSILQPSEQLAVTAAATTTTTIAERDWSKEGGLVMNSLGHKREAFTHRWWSGEVGPAQMQHIGMELWKTSTTLLQQHGFLQEGADL